MEPFHAKMVAAATGSTITALTMTPFDVVKTRLQTQPPPPRPLFTRPSGTVCCQPGTVPCVRNMSSMARSVSAGEIVCVWDHGMFRAERVNGFSDAVLHVWRAEGVRGLWKGAGTSLLIGVPASTSYMLTYDYLVHVFLPPIMPAHVSVPLFAGILARTSITSLFSPLELVRTNLQSTPLSVDNPHTLNSVLSSIRKIVGREGLICLWRGLPPSLWRDVPFSGLYWAGYETLKAAFEQGGHAGPLVAFCSGALSGTVAALLTSPFDVLKTRRQAVVMSSASGGITRIGPLVLHIVRTEGVGALFAGLSPRIAKIAPACGIMISCYEGVGRFLAKRD